MITAETAHQIAQAWLRAWNTRDLIALLDLYEDEIEFCSPFVRELYKVTDGTLRGKEALTAYFRKGLAGMPEVNFKIESVLISPDKMTVYYRSVNGLMSAEMMELSPKGLIRRAEAFYALS